MSGPRRIPTDEIEVENADEIEVENAALRSRVEELEAEVRYAAGRLCTLADAHDRCVFYGSHQLRFLEDRLRRVSAGHEGGAA